MKETKQTLVYREDPILVYYGRYVCASTQATIFEPIETTDLLVRLCDKSGPIGLIDDELWPVRAYDVALNLGHIATTNRYQSFPNSVTVMPFERYLDQGIMRHHRGSHDLIKHHQFGQPKELDELAFRELLNSACMLSTEISSEYRLLSPLPEIDVVEHQEMPPARKATKRPKQKAKQNSAR